MWYQCYSSVICLFYVSFLGTWINIDLTQSFDFSPVSHILQLNLCMHDVNCLFFKFQHFYWYLILHCLQFKKKYFTLRMEAISSPELNPDLPTEKPSAEKLPSELTAILESMYSLGGWLKFHFEIFYFIFKSIDVAIGLFMHSQAIKMIILKIKFEFIFSNYTPGHVVF